MDTDQTQSWRGHPFTTEAVLVGTAWRGRYRIDFMASPAEGHTLGVRCAVPLEPGWATPNEALSYATEQAHAAIDAYERLADEAVGPADSGLRDQRLILRYSLKAEDGVERELECAGAADALRLIRRFGDELRHAFVLDAAGTVLVEAGEDDRAARTRPDHMDWPQTA